MATYQIRLHTEDGAIAHTYDLELWEGNRTKTNRKVLAIASSLYVCLAYQDEESFQAVWMAAGLAALNWCEERIKEPQDWRQGAMSLVYPDNGRDRTACFTLNQSLGGQLCPSEEFFVDDGDRNFAIAYEGVC